MYDTMADVPISIEHVIEIKNYLKQVPTLVKSLEEQMRTTLYEYEILEHFWYALTDDDFALKWEAVGWPRRIFKQVTITRDDEEAHVDRFRKQQVSDMGSLTDRIEAMNMQLAAFAIGKVADKALENSIEAKKLWRTLDELLAYGGLLNVRQLLFDLPEREMGDVQEMRENFMPYRDVWTLAAEYVKAEEGWCGNPLLVVDIAVVRTTMAEFRDKLVALKDVFQVKPEMLTIIDGFVDRIDKFEKSLGIIPFIQHETWGKAQWNKIVDKSGIKVKFSPDLTFGNCIEKGLIFHEQLFESICNEAILHKEQSDAARAEAERVQREKEEYENARKARRLRRTEI
jgi:hypothetical protein